MKLSGGIVLASPALLLAAASGEQNLGVFTIETGVSVTLSDGTTPSVSGTQPGTYTLELSGSTVGTISLSEAGETTFTPSPASWLRGDAYEYASGLLFRMPLASNPGGDNQDGTNWYIDLCDAAGLSAVGCTSGNYATNSQYTQGGRGGGVNGWGDMSCNIDDWISSNTGWSNFIHLQSENSHLYGDSTGMNTNNFGSSSPVHPICAIRP